jgi:hypothetical protein
MANYYEKNNNFKKAQIIDKALELLSEENDVERVLFFSDFFKSIYEIVDMSTKNLLENYIPIMDDMISKVYHKYDLSSLNAPKDISEMINSIESLLSLMKDDSSEEATYLKEVLNMLKISIEDYKRIF